jgi:hypothetical protein
VHKTDAREKAKVLKRKARELARDAKATKRAANTLPEAREKARELQEEADKARVESEALKLVARLEDLNVWIMEKTKTTKKGIRSYSYWMANWREGDKVRNVHLGSCKKISQSEALQKAKAIKAEALKIKL